MFSTLPSTRSDMHLAIKQRLNVSGYPTQPTLKLGERLLRIGVVLVGLEQLLEGRDVLCLGVLLAGALELLPGVVLVLCGKVECTRGGAGVVALVGLLVETVELALGRERGTGLTVSCCSWVGLTDPVGGRFLTISTAFSNLALDIVVMRDMRWKEEIDGV